MALGYAWFDSYDNVGYVLTLHISPHTVCPYLPIAKRAFFFCGSGGSGGGGGGGGGGGTSNDIVTIYATTKGIHIRA